MLIQPTISSQRRRNYIALKVLEYCEHHRNDPLPPLDSEWGMSTALDLKRRKNTQIGDWDQQYIKCDQELLFEVIQAASYLDIKSLLWVSVLYQSPIMDD